MSSSFVSALGYGRQFKYGRVATAWLGTGAEAFRQWWKSGNQSRPSEDGTLRGQGVGKARKCSDFVSYLCN